MNILFLFTDQQRSDTIGALGASWMSTPHLDRIAREGTAFTNAYTPAPECVPARCALTFGQHPCQTGCYDNRTVFPFDSKETIMAALGRAGYYTHGIGKCHFAHPDPDRVFGNNGFDSREIQEEFSNLPERDDYLKYLRKQGLDYITEPHGVRGELYYMPQPARMPAESHPTQWVGDRTIAFLKDQEQSRRPWYCFSSFIHPHPPFAPPPPWHKLYRDFETPSPHMPPDSEHLLLWINRYQNRYKRFDRGLDLHRIRMIRAYYYACISFIDFQIGRILKTLEDTGQLEDTLIVFSSDHGELLGDYGCVGKRSFHDAASRVPLLVRHPASVPQGQCRDTPVSLIDVTRTLLDAAEGSFKTHVCEGENLITIANQPNRDRTVFIQHSHAEKGLYTAVNRDHKYVYSATDRRELFFDRRSDPMETQDLSDPGRDCPGGLPAARDALKQELIAFLERNGETAAIEDGDWKSYPVSTLPTNPNSAALYQDPLGIDWHIPGYSR